MMAKSSNANGAARILLVATALLLPTISLLPLGGLYLWEKGWLLWWALIALMLVLVVATFQRWLLAGTAEQRHVVASETGSVDPTWSPLEQQAWSDISVIAANADIDQLTEPRAIAELAAQVIEAVAKRVHPEKSDAIWQFTLPEALMITEQASRRLAGHVQTHIPFGDRMTLAQFWAIYRWRGAIDVVERAYDVWRIIRLINPATALTNEARDRLSKALVKWGREHVSRKLVAAFADEVGRAAIDLYGGRLIIPSNTIANRSVPTGKAPDLEPQTDERPRGWFSAGKQAVSAVASLGRAVVKRRPPSSRS